MFLVNLMSRDQFQGTLLRSIQTGLLSGIAFSTVLGISVPTAVNTLPERSNKLILFKRIIGYQLPA